MRKRWNPAKKVVAAALFGAVVLSPSVARAEETENPTGSDFYTMNILAELARNDEGKAKSLAGPCWPALRGLMGAPARASSSVHKVSERSTTVTLSEPTDAAFTLSFDPQLLRQDAPGACRTVTWLKGAPDTGSPGGRFDQEPGVPPQRAEARQKVVDLASGDRAALESDWKREGSSCWDEIKEVPPDWFGDRVYSAGDTDAYVGNNSVTLLTVDHERIQRAQTDKLCIDAKYLIPVEWSPERAAETGIPVAAVEYADNLVKAWLGHDNTRVRSLATKGSAVRLIEHEPGPARWFRFGYAWSREGTAFLYKSEEGEGLIITVPRSDQRSKPTAQAMADFVEF